jgi:hypothetical protein
MLTAAHLFIEHTLSSHTLTVTPPLTLTTTTTITGTTTTPVTAKPLTKTVVSRFAWQNFWLPIIDQGLQKRLRTYSGAHTPLAGHSPVPGQSHDWPGPVNVTAALLQGWNSR